MKKEFNNIGRYIIPFLFGFFLNGFIGVLSWKFLILALLFLAYGILNFIQGGNNEK